MVKLHPEQIEKWVMAHFPDAKKRSKGKQFVINNPFDGDTGYHFWISTELSGTKKYPDRINYWVHDFRPGHYRRTFLGFVMDYKKVTKSQAIREVAGSNVRIITTPRLNHIKGQPEIKEVKLSLCSTRFLEKTTDPSRKIALNYLAKRCVSEDLAINLDLYYTPNTIVFPYIEYDEIVFWQERFILNKRFNFPNEADTGLIKTDYIYNFDNVEQPAEHVTVVESIFNCISVWENCVATGGATIAGRQVDKLKLLRPKLVVLAPDNDQPDSGGKRAGLESLKSNFFLLRSIFNLAYCLPPDGIKDWNEMDQKHGIGTAQRYINNNTAKLTLPVIMKLLSH